jgi:hypothetical protein
MKLQTISAVILLSLSLSSFAAPAKPSSCVSVPAIQAVGVGIMTNEGGAWYGHVESNNYSTNEEWSFNIGSFMAVDESEARDKAVNALSSLTYLQGPVSIKLDGRDSWVCIYKDTSGHRAGMITPVVPSRSWINRI